MRAWITPLVSCSFVFILVADLGGGGGSGAIRLVEGVPQFPNFLSSFFSNPPWKRTKKDKNDDYRGPGSAGFSLSNFLPGSFYGGGGQENHDGGDDGDYEDDGGDYQQTPAVVDAPSFDNGPGYTALPSSPVTTSILYGGAARSDDGEVCHIGGTEFPCKFSPFCWMTGGEGAGPCTGGALNTCCVPRGFTARASSVSARSRRKYEYVHTPPRLIEAPVRNDPVCGRPRMTLQKRIIGGSEANFGELPWQVHIRISGYQCGGVLLNHFYVATAAHCVHKAHIPLIQIHIGDLDTKNTGAFYEPMPSDTFAVEEIIIHPYFKFMSVQPDRFDVALLRLDRPVNYRANILPICLPTDPDADFEGMMGVVAGWGKTDTSYGKTGTNILNKVPVPVISNRECKKWHGLKNIRVALHDEMTCAGWMDGKMDACLGDSGSPLIVNDRGRWTLIGITSAGFGCAVDHQPGIYHRVAKTAGWISAMIWT